MRGPLFSGAVGSKITLERVAALAGDHAPAVVLSTIWVGEALAERVPLALLIETDGADKARRALRRRRDGKLVPLVAGAELPLRTGAVGALIVEGVLDIEAGEAAGFLAGLVPHLRPGGLLIALDGTKSLAAEADLGGLFLAAGLVGLAQERPREGAVLTLGRAPAAVITAARQRAPAAHWAPA